MTRHVQAGLIRPDAPPKFWRDMTPEERGALLLAHHEGKVIEFRYEWPDYWSECARVGPTWDEKAAYRLRPESKRETVQMFWKTGQGAFASLSLGQSTHRITFDMIDGEPDCNSIGMEPLR